MYVHTTAIYLGERQQGWPNTEEGLQGVVFLKKSCGFQDARFQYPINYKQFIT